MRKRQISLQDRILIVPEYIIPILNRIKVLKKSDKRVACFGEGILFWI